MAQLNTRQDSRTTIDDDCPLLRHIAIVGASGAVGREFIGLLDRGTLPVRRISLLSSKRSAGITLNVRGDQLRVDQTSSEKLADVSLAVFCATADVSRKFAPIVVDAGGFVVDNSSAFRLDPGVPLVVPEVNPGDLDTHRGIVANPNCTTIILLMAIAPIHRVVPIKRIVASTYQAASGAGTLAMDELLQQTRDQLDGREIRPTVFPHPIAFNLFAHDSAIDETGYNGEERKVITEVRKILHAPELPVAITCVRVPVLRAHSESINLTFSEPVTPERIREILAAAPGLRIVDDRERGLFPMPVDASGRDEVLVGRIRSDLSQPNGQGIEMFVCGDQLRKGAALNALQIVETLVGAAT